MPLFAQNAGGTPAVTGVRSPMGGYYYGAAPLFGGTQNTPAHMKEIEAVQNAAAAQNAARGGALPQSPAQPQAPTALPQLQMQTVAPTTNTAGVPSNVTAATDAYNARVAEQKAKEGVVDPNLQKQVDRLGESLSTDTSKRLISQAGSSVRDAMLGVQAQKNADIAKRLGNNPYAQNAVSSSISDAAARAIAKQSANLTEAERQRKDALTIQGQQIMAAPGQEKLAREGATNQLVSGAVGANIAPADLALKQQAQNQDTLNAANNYSLQNARLGLDAASLNQNAALANQRAQMDQFSTLLRLAGY